MKDSTVQKNKKNSNSSTASNMDNINLKYELKRKFYAEKEETRK